MKVTLCFKDRNTGKVYERGNNVRITKEHLIFDGVIVDISEPGLTISVGMYPTREIDIPYSDIIEIHKN